MQTELVEVPQAEKIMQEERSVVPQQKIDKKPKRSRRKNLIVQVLYEPTYEDVYSTIIEGDLYCQIPCGYYKSPSFKSELNRFKRITRINHDRRNGFVEAFFSSMRSQTNSNELFLKLLNMRQDSESHQLSQLLDEYIQRVEIYKKNIKVKDKDFPLLHSLENYRASFNAYLDEFLQQFQLQPLVYFRYYFDPYDKLMHLASIAYNEQFLEIMGAQAEDYIKILKEHGIIQHIHPNSHISFMIRAMKNQLGKVQGPQQLEDLDLFTFDEITVPFNQQAIPVVGQPNEDGYSETAFVFKINIKPHILQSLMLQRSLEKNSFGKMLQDEQTVSK